MNATVIIVAGMCLSVEDVGLPKVTIYGPPDAVRFVFNILVYIVH